MAQQNTNSEVKSIKLNEFIEQFGIEFSNTEEGTVILNKVEIVGNFYLSKMLTIDYITKSSTVDEKIERMKECLYTFVHNNIKNLLTANELVEKLPELERMKYEGIVIVNFKIKNIQEIRNCLIENNSNSNEVKIQAGMDGLILSNDAYERFLKVHNVTK